MRVNPGMDIATGQMTGINYRLPSEQDNEQVVADVMAALGRPGAADLEARGG